MDGTALWSGTNKAACPWMDGTALWSGTNKAAWPWMDGTALWSGTNKAAWPWMDGTALWSGTNKGMSMDGRYSLVVGNCLIDLTITEFCRNRVNVIQADGLVAGFIWQF
jgi:hypothetical protein